jgi:hypothetical protein
MSKKLPIFGFLLLLFLLAIAVPGLAYAASAHTASGSPTTFYACVDDSTHLVVSASTLQNQCVTGQTEVAYNVQGPQGNQGNQGFQGPIGLTGPQGVPGLQGSPGPQGTQGPKGDTGPIGLTGPQGLPGAQGAQGVPGLSSWTTVRTGYFNVAPGTIEAAMCPSGDVVLSGGTDLGVLNQQSAISLSRPDYSLHGWDAAYSGAHTTFRVWAVCATVA